MSDRPFGADQFYGPYPSWERTRGWYGALHQTLGKKTEVDLAVRRHTDLYVLFRDDPGIYTNRHRLDSYQAAIRRSNELTHAITLHYGGEAFRDVIASTNCSGASALVGGYLRSCSGRSSTHLGRGVRRAGCAGAKAVLVFGGPAG